jgi:hypothetical protein
VVDRSVLKIFELLGVPRFWILLGERAEEMMIGAIVTFDAILLMCNVVTHASRFPLSHAQNTDVVTSLEEIGSATAL